MAKEWFKDVNFRAKSLKMIDIVNDIVNDIVEGYQRQGLRLTLRQTYYQCIVRNLFPNSERSYKNLGNLISEARLAGIMDWDAIEDRVRRPRASPEYADVEDVINAAFYSYRLPRWEGQENYVELWCFPPETLVSTTAGVQPINTINVGDEVIDRDGVARRVKNVFRRPYKGKLVEVKACGLPVFRATPEHPTYTTKADTSKPGYTGAQRRYLEPGFVPTSTLSKFDLLHVPRLKTTEAVTHVSMEGGPRTQNEPTVKVDDAFLAVAGFYLAEGSIRGDERTVQFVFNRSESAYAKKVERWAKAVGFNTSMAFGAGTRVVYLYGKAAANFFGVQFGRGSGNKRLPGWVMTLPVVQQMRLIEHYFRGDACLCHGRRDGISLGTRSETLARQVQLVLGRCGYASAYCVLTDHGEPTYKVAINGTHAEAVAEVWGLTTPYKKRRFSHMKVTDDATLHPVKSVREIDFEGEVYNLEVEGTNTYCVPCVVHNCEKDALAGVISPIASEYHVTLLVNRGYSSQSAMYESAKRFQRECKESGKYPHLIYLGDMDPSGEDMVRDISDRLAMYSVPELEVTKIALTMEQVEEYNPPPNPAKLSDSRAEKYIERHGDSSWEVDALPPVELGKVIREALDRLVDKDLMATVIAQEEIDKKAIKEMARKYKESRR